MAEASTPAPSNMDLVVRTLYKTLVLTNVDGNADVAELKASLHRRGVQEQIPIPIASKQRLVFKGAVLSTGTLHEAGVRSGDHLVLLLHRASNAGLFDNVRPVDTTPVPTSATIRAAILAEARRRGIENTIVEEPQRTNRHYGMPVDAMAAEVDNHLMQLIEALGGRTAGLAGRGAQPRQQAGAAGEGEAAAGAGQPAQAGAGGGAAGGAHRRLQPPPAPAPHGGLPPPGMMLFGMPPPLHYRHHNQAGAAAGIPGAPVPPPAVPEPDGPAAAQLGEMGFGEAVVRKALLLHRNDMEAALNWLLQHGEDPAAAEPLTDEQLRQIYSRGPRGPPSEPELVEQLVAMGFGRNQSQAALRRFRNMDMALAYLLRTAEAGAGGQDGAAVEGAAPQQGQQQQQQTEQQGQRQGQQEQAGPEVQGSGAAGLRAAAGPAAQEVADGGEASARRPGGGEVEGAGAMGLDEADVAELPRVALSDEGEDSEMRDDAVGRGEQRGDGAQGQAAMDVDQESGDEEELEAGGEGEGGEEEEVHGEEEEDDEFTGHGMPTMIEQLAMGPGAGRGAVLRVPLGGGGLDLAAGGLADEGLGGFGAPFALYGAAANGVGSTAPAVAVTRGPDGNDLVLGAPGAAMPPLMPARGMMLGGLGGGDGGGMVGIMGPGGGGAGPQLLDLPGLFQGGNGGDDEVMQGMGLMQQLLSAVLRDALNGGEAGQGGPPGGRR